jgi:AcrR family transcriptional regulator
MSAADMDVSSDLSSTENEARTRRKTAAERASADTRQRLMASGRALFAEHGLHSITTHDIAGHAGVAAGTFYNHFSDKTALFREITNEAVSELERRLRVADAPGQLPREGVRARAEALVSFGEDHRELIRILFSRDAEVAATQSDVLDRLANRIAGNRARDIEAGQTPAGIDPMIHAQIDAHIHAQIHAHIRAQALVGMWSRVLAWWAEDPSRAPRETVIETLTKIQREGTHPA